MKLLIFGDLHIGNKKHDPVFHRIALEYGDWLVDVATQYEVDGIVSLGDIFHDRFRSTHETNDCAFQFFQKLKDFKVDVIVGNHDVLYTDSTEVNYLQTFSEWSNVTVHEKVTKIGNVVFCGWNPKLTDIPNAEIIFGHFDVQGFIVNGTTLSTHGFKGGDLMEKCKLCISGHYHKYQERVYSGGKRFYYLGSAYQQNWGESGQQKRVFVLDTDTLEITTVFNEQSPTFEFINTPEDLNKIQNNFIKVYAANNEQAEDFKKKCLEKNPLTMDSILVESDAVETVEERIKEIKVVDIPEVIADYVQTGLENLTNEQKQEIIEESKRIFRKHSDKKI